MQMAQTTTAELLRATADREALDAVEAIEQATHMLPIDGMLAPSAVVSWPLLYLELADALGTSPQHGEDMARRVVKERDLRFYG
jgi:hypothetical protein